MKLGFKLAWLALSLGALPSVAGAKAPAKKETAPAGLWKPLVAAGARWTLVQMVEKAQKPGHVVVETYDVRKVAGADVARLRYTVTAPGGKGEALPDGPPAQLAVSDKGAWVFERGADDAAIARALAKKKPDYLDPPALVKGGTRKDGKYTNLIHVKKGDKVCIGDGPAKGAGECEDVCFAEVCLSPAEGLVSLGGTWAPNAEPYEAAGWGQ